MSAEEDARALTLNRFAYGQDALLDYTDPTGLKMEGDRGAWTRKSRHKLQQEHMRDWRRERAKYGAAVAGPPPTPVPPEPEGRVNPDAPLWPGVSGLPRTKPLH